jgi:peptide deformylase
LEQLRYNSPMIRPILQSGDPVLRQLSKPVTQIDKKVLELIKDLKDTLVVQKDPEGIGLAAPQIGKNVRIFLMKPKPSDPITVIINPKIVSIEKQKAGNKKSKKRTDIMEGCLSLPHFYGPLVRAPKIIIEYMDENGSKQTQSYEGLLAQIVQHEIDHLDGVIFIDRLLEQKKPLYEFRDGEWERVEIL